MKKLLFVLILALGLVGYAQISFADEEPDADVQPDEAVSEDEAIEEPVTDLEKENAELKEKIQELEAKVVELTPEPAPPAPAPNFWNLKYNLDISYFLGNSESLLFDQALKLVYDNLEDWKAQFLFEHKLLLQGDTTAEHLGSALLKLNYYVDPMFSPYGYTRHGWQESTKTHYFAELGLGVEWIFARDPYAAGDYAAAPNYQFKLSVGALYEYLEYAPSANLPIARNIRLEVQLDGEVYLAEDMMFGMMINFKPNVEDFDDYNIQGLFWLDWVYDKNTRFKFSYEILYKSVTAAARNADHILKAGVEITFGW